MESLNRYGTAELRPEKSFSSCEEEFWALRGKLGAGRVSLADFNAAVAKLEMRDQHGKVWRIHPEAGVWLLLKNNQWIEANPYGPDTDGTVQESVSETVGHQQSTITAPAASIKVVLSEPVGERILDSQSSGVEPARTLPPIDVSAASATFPACRQCGAVLGKGKKFCVKCGTPCASELPPPPTFGQADNRSAAREPLTFDSEPLPPPASGGLRHVFGGTGREAIPSIQQPKFKKPARPETSLPPPAQAWGFQDKLTGITAKAIGAVEQTGLSSRTGLGGILPRMIRAALLDKTIYRELAADGSLQSDAWKAMILVVVLSSSGALIAAIQYLSASMLYSIIPAAVIQSVALIARIWVTQMIASAWFKTSTGFNPFFRSLVFAQSPAILQIIPVAGQFMGLWRLVTSTAAIRDVTGCSTQNAAILAIVSILGDILAVSLAGPFVRTILSGF